MKKKLGILLLILSVITAIPLATNAAETVDSGTCGAEGNGSNLTWMLDSEGTLTISGKGEMDHYGEYAYFAPWKTGRPVEKVIIEEGVTNIGDSAFSGLYSLTSVTIPSSVTNIRYSAFYNCSSLTSVTIPSGVTNIGASAFYDCRSLTSVTIPDGLLSIGSRAFYNCENLTNITVPESVTSIGFYAFENTAYYNNEDNWHEGALYMGNCLVKVIPDPSAASYSIKNGTKCIADGAFSNCNELKKITIPNSVTNLGDETFENCSGLINIDIPNNVTSIGYGTFEKCSGLINVDIPNSVTNIGDSAFFDCSSLTSATIPDSVTSIGDDAFLGCYKMTSVTISDGVTSIGDHAFCRCESLANVNIPNSVTKIGESAFSLDYNLTRIDIPSSVTEIGKGAFAGCRKLIIEVSSQNQYYSSIDGVLFNKDKTEILAYSKDEIQLEYVIPSSVSVICDYAFCECYSLTSVIIPSGITRIGNYAFESCNRLTSITIPDSVTYIGDYAFYYCFCLADIYYTDSESAWNKIEFGKNVLFDDMIHVTIHYDASLFGETVDSGDLGAYGNNITWTLDDHGVLTISGNGEMRYVDNLLPWYRNNNAIKSVIINDGITSIHSNAFFNCTNLTYVKIPNSVVDIEFLAFKNCSGLMFIYLPDSVKSIGHGAFEDCINLGDIKLPNNVSEIGDDVFNNTAYYNDTYNWKDGILYLDGILIAANPEISGEVNVEDGIANIAGGAFKKCANISKINIPYGVKYINNNVFSDCTSLSSVSIPSSVTFIGDSAFSNCTNISTITIPDGVTEINSGTFSGCMSLANITMPNGVTTIGDEAFSGCTSLGDITIPYGVVSIGNGAFRGCSNLNNLIIPDSVIQIGEVTGEVFDGCVNLSNITIPDSVTQLVASFKDTAYYNDPNNWSDGLLYINNHLVAVDKLVSGDLEIKPGTVTIYAFTGCENLNKVLIPEGVKRIENYAFSGCINLKELIIPKSIEYMGHGFLSDCKSIESLTIPNGKIGMFPFNASCENLKELNLLEGVTEIGYLAFEGASIETLIIPRSIKRIGSQAFSNCEKLQNIYYPGTADEWDKIDITPPGAFPDVNIHFNYNMPVSETTIQNDIITVSTNLDNIIKPEEREKSEVFVVLYDENDAVIDSYNAVYDGAEISGALKNDEKADHIKIFVWNRDGSFEPIADMPEYISLDNN